MTYGRHGFALRKTARAKGQLQKTNSGDSIIDLRNVERTRERSQFGAMQFGQSQQDFLARAQEMDFDLPAIDFAVAPFYQTQSFAPGDKRNNAMMTRLEPLSQFTNGCPLPVRISLNVK